MGLDIYLSSKKDGEASNAHWAALEKIYSDPAYDTWTAEEKEAKRAAAVAEFPDAPSRWDDENKKRDASKTNPEHYCNRRYLRSSYNDGGFNNAVPKWLVPGAVAFEPTFYGIFEPLLANDDGDLPNDGLMTADDIGKLESCRARALEVAEALKQSDRLTSIRVDKFPFPQQCTSVDEALAHYRSLVSDNLILSGGEDRWFSNNRGDFFGEKGVTILAAIPVRGRGGYGEMVLIYRAPEESITWYIECAQIAAEFCDEAIELIKQDGACYMTWSG